MARDPKFISDEARKLAEAAGLSFDNMPSDEIMHSADGAEKILRQSELQERRRNDDMLNRMGNAILSVMNQLADVKEAQSGLKEMLVRIEAQDIKSVVVDLRAEYRNDMLAIRKELRDEISEIKADLKVTATAATVEREAMMTRISLLEKEREHRVGAMGFVTWLKDFTPWMMALLAIAVAYYQKR